MKIEQYQLKRRYDIPRLRNMIFRTIDVLTSRCYGTLFIIFALRRMFQPLYFYELAVDRGIRAKSHINSDDRSIKSGERRKFEINVSIRIHKSHFFAESKTIKFTNL